MSHRQLLLNALQKYKTSDSAERKMLQEMIDFVQNNPNCFERSNQAGHITGSAWLLSPDGKKALLTHHKKLKRWLQVGGHSDGQNNTWDVALREATEESGIQNISFLMQDIFDIDVHTIPKNCTKNEPEHKHYDVRFLLKAPTEKFTISDESNALKWVSAQKLLSEKGLSPSISRMLQKWIEMEKN